MTTANLSEERNKGDGIHLANVGLPALLGSPITRVRNFERNNLRGMDGGHGSTGAVEVDLPQLRTAEQNGSNGNGLKLR